MQIRLILSSAMALLLYPTVGCVPAKRASHPGLRHDLAPLVQDADDAAPLRGDHETPPLELQDFERPLLGVRFQVQVAGRDDVACAELAQELFALVEDIEALTSNWDPASEISRLNAEPFGATTELSGGLGEILSCALEFRDLSLGAFDPSVGTILSEMGFYGGGQRHVAASRLDVLRTRVGLHALRFEPPSAGGPPGLYRSDAMVRVDLSGVSKGWAVDRCVELLRERGVERAFISAGSSTVYALGAGPPGGAARGWTFQVPDGQGLWETWWLVDEAVSTSGKLSMPLDPGGVRASHLIDPRTCRPVAGPHAMSVFRGPSAAEADMASTALLVMGEARARELFNAGGAWGSQRCAMLVEPDGQRVELGEVPRLLPARSR